MDSRVSTNAIATLITEIATEAGQPHDTHLMTLLILQLALIIIAAKIGGFLFRRYLRLPSVLGELIAGILIGPYALGGIIRIPEIGLLFPITNPHFPVSTELYAIATIASILLLFLSGLKTDLTVFLRYSLVASLVGIGGIIFSFVLGSSCAVMFGVAESFKDPSALFLGAIATATSVGLTARILVEKRKISSPEGVTILGGAVIDDVLGIILLAIVVGITRLTHTGEHVHWGSITYIAFKALGFWLVCTVTGVLIARRLTGTLKHLRAPETIAGISLGLALLLAGLSEMAGLAMIIGAYIMGLSLSRTDIVSLLQNQLQGMYDMLVPVFFCVMGMLVNFKAMQNVIVFGLVYSLFAILAKVIGCGLPAWLSTFNLRGALRIGLGMLPRAEVALIIAGIGLSSHSIGQDIFGVAIMMTIITAFLAPPLLERSFAGGSGLKDQEKEDAESTVRNIVLDFPSADLAEFMILRLTQGFRNEEFFVYRLGREINTYQIRKDDMVFSLTQEGEKIILSAPARYEHIARFIALEELLVLHDLANAFEKMRDLDSMKSDLLRGIFDAED